MKAIWISTTDRDIYELSFFLIFSSEFISFVLFHLLSPSLSPSSCKHSVGIIYASVERCADRHPRLIEFHVIRHATPDRSYVRVIFLVLHFPFTLFFLFRFVLPYINAAIFPGLYPAEIFTLPELLYFISCAITLIPPQVHHLRACTKYQL